MMKNKETLLNVLKKNVPGLKSYDGQHTLVLCDKWLTNAPLDWMEFVMWAVKSQTETVNHLICLADEETVQAFDILAQKQFHAYVVPFEPPENQPVHIWELWCGPSDKDERWYYGGENLRKFCDSKNLFYRSFLNENGELLSGSQCIYQKHKGEDCRIPVNELPSGNSSIEAVTEPA